MRNFFAYDGPFIRVMTHVVDLIVLSFLFLLCSVPIFTIGASWSALYYTVHKVVKHDRGYVFGEFFRAFKSNFKQSTVVWCILFIIYTVLGTECYVMYQYAIKGKSIGYIYIALMVIIALLVIWAVYLFAYIARFKNTIKAIMKNAAFMGIVNLGHSFFMFVMLILAVLLVVAWPGLVFIVPGVYILIVERNLEKVFGKYMTEEDKKAEAEKNREFKN